MAKANKPPTKIPMMKTRYPIPMSDGDDDILTPNNAVGGTSRNLSEQQSSRVVEAPPMIAPLVISEQQLEDLHQMAAEQEGASNLLMNLSNKTKDIAESIEGKTEQIQATTLSTRDLIIGIMALAILVLIAIVIKILCLAPAQPWYKRFVKFCKLF